MRQLFSVDALILSNVDVIHTTWLCLSSPEQQQIRFKLVAAWLSVLATNPVVPSEPRYLSITQERHATQIHDLNSGPL